MGRASKQGKIRLNEQTSNPKANKKVQPKVVASTKKPSQVEAPTEATALHAETQQRLVDIYKDTFANVLESRDLTLTLQEIKGALYDRDFERAFGNENYLKSYAVRWSPSRTLCYAAILKDFNLRIASLTSNDDATGEVQRRLKVLALGGGAAEVVAFGAYARSLLDDARQGQEVVQDATIMPVTPNPSSDRLRLDLTLIDSAQWGGVLTSLHNGLCALPQLSKYANAAARQTNRSLIDKDDLSLTFKYQNMLICSETELASMCGNSAILVTLLFTLNELYTSSIALTTKFLLMLTKVLAKSSLLLVVDSPGSYSETVVGQQSKKYPMNWLLDHLLLDESSTEAPNWRKLVSEDSQWFRVDTAVRYPIPLENMRYQMHLYERI